MGNVHPKTKQVKQRKFICIKEKWDHFFLRLVFSIRQLSCGFHATLNVWKRSCASEKTTKKGLLSICNLCEAGELNWDKLVVWLIRFFEFLAGLMNEWFFIHERHRFCLSNESFSGLFCYLITIKKFLNQNLIS